MSSKQKLGLSLDDANKIIADVDGADRAAAQLAISKGVEAAQGQWLASGFIAEALALELKTVIQTTMSNKEAANYFRHLAVVLEQRSDIH